MALVKAEPAPPWQVFLMVNLASNSPRAGRVRVHRYPDAVAFYENLLHAPETHGWVVAMRVEGFADKSRAYAFAELWFRGTSHTDRLLAKALTIVSNHPAELDATVTALTAPEHRRRLARRKPGMPTTGGGQPRYVHMHPKPPASEVARRLPVLAPVLETPPESLRRLLQLVTLYDIQHQWVGPRTVAAVRVT